MLLLPRPSERTVRNGGDGDLAVLVENTNAHASRMQRIARVCLLCLHEASDQMAHLEAHLKLRSETEPLTHLHDLVHCGIVHRLVRGHAPAWGV